VTWATKMQTEVALSTTEAELIVMSEGLRMAIPLVNLIKEMAEQEIRDLIHAPRYAVKSLSTMQAR